MIQECRLDAPTCDRSKLRTQLGIISVGPPVKVYDDIAAVGVQRYAQPNGRVHELAARARRASTERSIQYSRTDAMDPAEAQALEPPSRPFTPPANIRVGGLQSVPLDQIDRQSEDVRARALEWPEELEAIHHINLDEQCRASPALAGFSAPRTANDHCPPWAPARPH